MRRGRVNTVVLVVVGGLLLLGGGAIAVGLVLEAGASTSQRLGIAVGGILALAFVSLVLRLLWVAQWWLSPQGITIRSGVRRHLPWNEIAALELSTGNSATAGNDYEVSIRTVSGELETTPTRQGRGDLERVLSFAVERGVVPERVRVKL